MAGIWERAGLAALEAVQKRIGSQLASPQPQSAKMVQGAQVSAPVSCDCGHQYAVPAVRLLSDRKVTCPSCGQVDPIDDDTVQRIAQELADMAKPAEHRARASKKYRVNIVGESNYQNSISACGTGEGVTLFHEPDNPYDERAIAVVSALGETIGYIARDTFVQEALIDEGKGYEAEIASIASGGKGLLGVILSLSLKGEPMGERAFKR
jgi:HIRAN domain